MKTVQVITGGTSGMGFATACKLAERGPVFIGGRNEKRLADSIEQLRSLGFDADGAHLDVSDRASVEEFAAAAQKVGAIGDVVHAAAIDMERADDDQLIATNVIGTINVVDTFFPLMTSGSAMANFSSVTGYYYAPTQDELAVWAKSGEADFAASFKKALQAPDPRVPLAPTYQAYFASKKFVMFYIKANTVRFANKGLRIFSVAPGSFQTPMFEASGEAVDAVKATTALGRIGDPKEMATLISHLLDPEVGYLTGVDVLMDGGMFAKRMVPQIQ